MKRLIPSSDFDRIANLRRRIGIAAANIGWSYADLSSLCDGWFAMKPDQLNLRQLEQLAQHFHIALQRELSF